MLISFGDAYPLLRAGAWVAPTAVVTGDVELGERSSLWFQSVARGDESPIRIGRETNVQDGCILHTSSGSPLFIGDRVSVGHLVVLHGCAIGDGTLVGIGSIVLDGAVLGKNCIVGAGSLVTKNAQFGEGQVLIGRPAKAVRTVTAEEVEANERRSQKYMRHAAAYARGAALDGPRGVEGSTDS